MATTHLTDTDLRRVREPVFRSSLSAGVRNDLAYGFTVFLVPKIGNQPSQDSLAGNRLSTIRQNRRRCGNEKVVAMISPKRVQIANRDVLKATVVAQQVAAILGGRFTTYDHSNPPFCVCDDLHKGYCYKPEWVAFLGQRLADPGLDASIITRRKAGGTPVDARSRTA